ncbi:MAG TPA: 2-dehydropantoate 2-reductase [Pararobbsia sp.]|jgi:2-dehydropantoate 2-reductase|nr:2-dehydropantoate 2-reductase [Pararobbsia sp.]
MKLLVLGAGAIGGYYGARLIEAGADVTFLVREKRQQRLMSQGLRVVSELGDFSRSVTSVLESELEPNYDLVLLTCKTYDLEPAADAIAPVMARGAKVLPFLNGIGAYDYLDARFGKANVLGGVAYIATTLGDDGVITQAGALDTVIVGARSAESNGLANAFHERVSQTKGRRVLSDNVDQALWDKWVMLAAGAITCCLMRGTVKEILATRAGERLMNQALDECAEVARRSGFALADATLNDTRARLLDRQSSWAPSMMRDIARDLPKLEADGIVGDMLTRADTLNVAATLTAAAYAHLQVYLARHARQ